MLRRGLVCWLVKVKVYGLRKSGTIAHDASFGGEERGYDLKFSGPVILDWS